MTQNVWTIQVPKQSDWQCRIAGNFYIIPNAGGEPNWFHRWAQRIVLGFVWEKRP